MEHMAAQMIRDRQQWVRHPEVMAIASSYIAPEKWPLYMGDWRDADGRRCTEERLFEFAVQWALHRIMTPHLRWLVDDPELNINPSDDPADRAMRFIADQVTAIRVDMIRMSYATMDAAKDLSDLITTTLRERLKSHLRGIAYDMVFGRFRNPSSRDDAPGGRRMAGFLQLLGRLPGPQDHAWLLGILGPRAGRHSNEVQRFLRLTVSDDPINQELEIRLTSEVTLLPPWYPDLVASRTAERLRRELERQRPCPI